MEDLYEAIIHNDDLNNSSNGPKLLAEGLYAPKEVFRVLWDNFQGKKPVGVIKNIYFSDSQTVRVTVGSQLNIEDQGIGIGYVPEEEKIVNGIRYITKARIVDFSLADRPLHDNYRFKKLTVK